MQFEFNCASKCSFREHDESSCSGIQKGAIVSSVKMYKNKTCRHTTESIKLPAFGAGEDQPQTRQPYDQAGS